jgi:hypothetical protein
LTLQARCDAFAKAYQKWPASWPHVVREKNRDVLYAIWLIGNDYRNKTTYYGAYPRGYCDRVMALFPDVRTAADVLHVFSGSVEAGAYATLDINPSLKPSIVGSVYDVAALAARRFRLIIADPPYTAADATHYGTPMVNRRLAIAALADVAEPGSHLVWLDTCWPMHSKRQWVTVGRILIQRSTNHRARVTTIFQRTETLQ